jgi:Zn-dependent protease
VSHRAPETSDAEGPPPRPRPPGTIRLGQISHVDVLVTPSWFLVAGLIAIVMAPLVEATQPGLGPWRYVAGLAFAVLFYGSVLLHEASHAVVAQRYGHEVSSITLHFLGGATAIEGESRRPGEEFWIAVVGPVTSILVGGLAVLLWLPMPDNLLRMAVGALAFANLVVGVLNLVPGLPLDGGRVLKSVVWGLTRNMHRGTIVAGWVGRGVAVLALFWPVAYEAIWDERADLMDYVICAVIAAFLWAGATQAMQSAKLRRKLPSIVGRDLARRTLAVPEELPLAEAVRRAQDAEAGSIITVDADGGPTGVVSEAAVLATPDDRRPWVATSTVARSLEPGMTLPAAIRGEDLIRAITFLPAHEYLLVEEDGSIFGVLSTADVDRAFRER